MNQRCAGCQRSFDAGHHRQRVVVDFDQRQRLFGDLVADGGNHGHALAPIAHLVIEDVLVARERGIARRRGAVVQHARYVVVGQHRLDAGQGARLRGIDAADGGVRDGGAQGAREQHAGQAQVARIARAAGDLFDHIAAPCRGADDVEAHRAAPDVRICLAAAATASIILV